MEPGISVCKIEVLSLSHGLSLVVDIVVCLLKEGEAHDVSYPRVSCNPGNNIFPQAFLPGTHLSDFTLTMTLYARLD